MWTTLMCGLYSQWESIGEKLLFLLWAVDTGDNFWVKFGGLCPLPLSALGLHLSEPVQDLGKLIVSLSCCHFSPAVPDKHCFLAIIHLPQFSQFFLPSLLNSLLGSERRILMKTSYLRLRVTKSLFLHIVLVQVCVSSHLLQGEASLDFWSCWICGLAIPIKCCLNFSTVFHLSHPKSDAQHGQPSDMTKIKVQTKTWNISS